MSSQPTGNASSTAREPRKPPHWPADGVTTSLIETRGVSKSYGAVRALEDVSISVREGEFVSIVGPNGAGKTTLVNLLTGLLVPTQGEVYFKGRNIAGVGPVALATRGMARTFQLVEIFPQLTVAETIAAAVVTRQGKRWRLLSVLLEDAEIATRVAEVASIFGLSSRLATVSHLLSQGEKKLLDVASAFALEPQLILLDEPMAGMNFEEKEDMARYVVDLNEEFGMTVVMIEHDMGVVMDISHRVMVLDFGRKIAEGDPAAVLADPHVKRAYLGEEDEVLVDPDDAPTPGTADLKPETAA